MECASLSTCNWSSSSTPCKAAHGAIRSGKFLGETGLCKWQFPNALSRGGKNGVAKRRGKGRQAGFADSRRRRVAGHDVNIGFSWRIVDPRHRESIEVRLVNH